MAAGPAGLYLVAYVVTIVVTTGAAVLALQQQRRALGYILAALLLSAAAWSAGMIAILLFESLAVFWAALVFVTAAGTVSVTCWFLFAIEFTDSWPLSRRTTVGLLAVEPVAAVAVTVLSRGTDFVYAVDPTAQAGLPALAVSLGPGYVAHVLYSYAIFGFGVALVLRLFTESRSIFRRQAAALLVAALPPFVSHLLFFAGVVSIDVTPIGYAMTGVVLLFATERTGFMDVTPVARDEVVRTIDEAVFVLDDDDRLVDVNPTGAALLDTDQSELIGHTLEEVLDHLPGFRREFERIVESGGGEMTVSADGALRDIDVQMSELRDREGSPVGRVFVARDVTDQKRRERELERKNEQLDRFASVVSHDLRNPLSVASGRAELALETGDLSHVEDVLDSLDRMESIIDDILTLAREGQTIDERHDVDLGEIAGEAWAHVDAPEATVRLETDLTVSADPDRLQRLFENLFRNAVEHGGASVTVTVGDDRDQGAFYVADDGPGIPADERETVLEHGYTTHEDGTGFGLAIVASIARAHGWDVAITESGSGGARIEVLNVAPADEDAQVREGGLFGDVAEQPGDG
ncbi:MAG: histidine kinase N-terminal 7TM domain-containing protein [Halorientalis sp.]